MGSPDFVFLPSNVLPGQTVDLSMNLIAPEVAGKYQGNWQFEAPSGKVFGVGDAADQPIWLRIRVITPSINTSTITPMPSSVARHQLEQQFHKTPLPMILLPMLVLPNGKTVMSSCLVRVWMETKTDLCCY